MAAAHSTSLCVDCMGRVAACSFIAPKLRSSPGLGVLHALPPLEFFIGPVAVPAPPGWLSFTFFRRSCCSQVQMGSAAPPESCGCSPVKPFLGVGFVCADVGSQANCRYTIHTLGRRPTDRLDVGSQANCWCTSGARSSVNCSSAWPSHLRTPQRAAFDALCDRACSSASRISAIHGLAV